MAKERLLTCIVCPRGCQMRVFLTDDGNVAKVVYENNVVFYINYGEVPYNIDELNTDVPVGGYVKVSADGKDIKVWRGAE